MTYVFEPNNEAFWRLVRHRFEQLLAYLYTRGAFAGTTPDQAFRVVTDSSLNTAESLDQGRFIVELRVAPSRPLTFLTIRLVQTDRQGLSIREVS
jgi:phage tail sheath protein FI